MTEALGNKFMGVASFILLRLQCESSVSASELMSHASALIDGYALSKGPAASRVIPLLNLSSNARRLTLPHLAAQSELHLAFALAAARKHVQVEEVRILLSFWPRRDVPATRAYFVPGAQSHGRCRCCSAESTLCFDAPACPLNVAMRASSQPSASWSLQRCVRSLNPLSTPSRPLLIPFFALSHTAPRAFPFTHTLSSNSSACTPPLSCGRRTRPTRYATCCASVQGPPKESPA